MTLKNIKNNTLRRFLICVSLPLLPLVIASVSFVVAADSFLEEFSSQWNQGGCGLWEAVKSCWKG